MDLGAGGLFLRTALPLPPGTSVDVHLELPGAARPVVARGRVVRHVAPAEGSRPGLGVRFERLDEAAGELARFLGRPVP